LLVKLDENIIRRLARRELGEKRIFGIIPLGFLVVHFNSIIKDRSGVAVVEED
jgi:hypothetical protein